MQEQCASSRSAGRLGKRISPRVYRAHNAYRETVKQLVGDHKPDPDGKSAVDFFLRFVAFHCDVEAALIHCDSMSPEKLNQYTLDILNFLAVLDRLTGGLYDGHTHGTGVHHA